jgi:hypothetical protein
VARLCLAILLALACALPVAAQDKDQDPPTDEEQVAAIVLPDNPSREQSQAYIQQIAQLAKGLRKRGTSYDRVLGLMASAQKFDAVPDRDMDLLISTLADDESFYVSFEIARSIDRRDPKVIQPIIIAGLDDHPDNILAIRYFGWYEAAKEPILRKLETIEKLDLPQANAWFHAFTHLAEPRHYPKFKQLFISMPNRSNQAFMLETMPGYDVLDTIRACIAETEKKIADGSQSVNIRFAYSELEKLWVIAARAGDVDTLGKLIDAINDPKHRDPFFNLGSDEMIDGQRFNITQLIKFKGSNQEIQAWYWTHRDQLVFNPFAQRFELPDN